MRVVLDTNVLLSALFTRGICEALLDALLELGTCRVVLSEHILAEFRDHAAKKFGAPADEVERAVDVLGRRVEIVEPALPSPDACTDPDDLPVLGIGVAGRADVLVTGDGELLALREVHGMPILSPRDLYERLR